MAKSADMLAFGVIDVTKVVKGSSFANAVTMLLADFQVSPAANDRLLELAHHFQCVAKITRCLGFSESVTHGPGQGQVVFVVLHGLDVVTHVKVGVAELAVDGTESSKVVGASLKGCFEEGHAIPAVAGLAQLLTLQSQLQASVVVAFVHRHVVLRNSCSTYASLTVLTMTMPLLLLDSLTDGLSSVSWEGPERKRGARARKREKWR